MYESAGQFRFEKCNSNYFKVQNIVLPTKLANHLDLFISFSACVHSCNFTYINNIYSVYIGLRRNLIEILTTGWEMGQGGSGAGDERYTMLLS